MPMSKRLLISGTLAAVAVAVAILVGSWWLGKFNPDRQRSSIEDSDLKMPLQSSDGALGTKERQAGEYKENMPEMSNISDFEFARLRVALPEPVNKPWRGAVFNSNNYLEPDRKLRVVEILPGWIRKAMHEGNADLAARFLWSLKRLAEEDDEEVSSEAVLAIYRLGDIDEFARNRINDWIKSGWDFKTYDTSFGKSEFMDIRARVLREFSFYHDTSFNGSIYEAWEKNQAVEETGLCEVDYAYFLEAHGRELPNDYWMERLNNPFGFAPALEIAMRKNLPELTSKLSSLFESIRDSQPASGDARRAANVASVLFQKTGDVRYLGYLIDQAKISLNSSSFESNLSEVLSGLAATNDQAALEVVSSAIESENGVIRDMAIGALGRASSPATAELLFEEAIEKATTGAGFPAREMRALLAQNDPSADSKYERLQQLLLSGKLGWTATKGDFDKLELFRKYKR
jgi:hypothetical protein